MTLKISPSPFLGTIEKGTDATFRLNCNPELDGDTIASHTYKLYDSDATEQTTNYGGGSTETSGYISFGVIGYDTGAFTIEIWVVCTETLPDASTAKNFLATMSFTVV